MTATRFAESWIAAWNRRDVESVLAMYAEKLVFTSPTALEITGHATVKGKVALRSYWQEALQSFEYLRFSLDRIVWDEHARELSLVYTRDVNGARKRVVETFLFDEQTLVVATDVFHGPVPEVREGL